MFQLSYCAAKGKCPIFNTVRLPEATSQTVNVEVRLLSRDLDIQSSIGTLRDEVHLALNKGRGFHAHLLLGRVRLRKRKSLTEYVQNDATQTTVLTLQAVTVYRGLFDVANVDGTALHFIPGRGAYPISGLTCNGLRLKTAKSVARFLNPHAFPDKYVYIVNAGPKLFKVTINGRTNVMVIAGVEIPMKLTLIDPDTGGARNIKHFDCEVEIAGRVVQSCQGENTTGLAELHYGPHLHLHWLRTRY